MRRPGTSGRFFLTSVTRNSDLAEGGFRVEQLRRDRWSTGDFVAGEVRTRASGRRIELASGRAIEVAEGDLVVGALGRREATLEVTGSWEEVQADGRMHVLSGGGVIGRMTSRAADLSPPVPLLYRGHVTSGSGPVRMRPRGSGREPGPWRTPTVLLVGTSMSAGKTTAAQVIVRRLKRQGRRVCGAKLTGSGRWADVLTMRDAGADAVVDFVDGGLPSTVVPEEEYRPALRRMLALMTDTEPDVAVVEIGASPLEPYNGSLAVRTIRDAVGLTVLCASDPYAVLGVERAWGDAPGPDLVTGVASNTSAGRRLVRELSGIPCLDVRREESLPELDRTLGAALDG